MFGMATEPPAFLPSHTNGARHVAECGREAHRNHKGGGQRGSAVSPLWPSRSCANACRCCHGPSAHRGLPEGCRTGCLVVLGRVCEGSRRVL